MTRRGKGPAPQSPNQVSNVALISFVRGTRAMAAFVCSGVPFTGTHGQFHFHLVKPAIAAATPNDRGVQPSMRIICLTPDELCISSQKVKTVAGNPVATAVHFAPRTLPVS